MTDGRIDRAWFFVTRDESGREEVVRLYDPPVHGIALDEGRLEWLRASFSMSQIGRPIYLVELGPKGRIDHGRVTVKAGHRDPS